MEFKKKILLARTFGRGVASQQFTKYVGNHMTSVKKKNNGEFNTKYPNGNIKR